ncbi:MAG: IS200/IS605 family transposase [Gemmataceae bacterium]|nr:IS200/IS605 family transposase [Gemmataceae bacterium]
MPQSLANLLVHLVFSTKNRQPFLQDGELQNEMHRYLAGICKDLDCMPVRVGGVGDHVHVLARQARTISVSDWIKELKRVSSLWIKTKAESLSDFQWQAGYAAFSVSRSQSPVVDRYIAEQERHHRAMSFQDELRALLEKHSIEYDERYVWD